MISLKMKLLGLRFVTMLGWSKWHIIRMVAYGDVTLCGLSLEGNKIHATLSNEIGMSSVGVCKKCWESYSNA